MDSARKGQLMPIPENTFERNEKFETWAIVELMGHRKLAGKVSEQIIAGVPLLRIDIPEGKQDGTILAAYSQFYGASSIYCLTPTTEELARRYNLFHREQPVRQYELPQLEAVASDNSRVANSMTPACEAGDCEDCPHPDACTCSCHDPEG
jgi:hypothetical protein